MIDKYSEWYRLINNLMLQNNRYELLDLLKNISLRRSHITDEKEFLLLIDLKKKKYQLFYEK